MCFIAPHEGSSAVVDSPARSSAVRAIQWLQWLTWGGDHWPYIHVELFLHTTREACGVIPGRPVWMLDSDIRVYMREGWRFYYVPCSAERERAVRAFFVDAVARKAAFNTRGMSLLSMVMPQSGEGQAYFCSELVSEALRAGGLMSREGPESHVIPVAGLMDMCVSAEARGATVLTEDPHKAAGHKA